jgi:hypothetical protein
MSGVCKMSLDLQLSSENAMEPNETIIEKPLPGMQHVVNLAPRFEGITIRERRERANPRYFTDQDYNGI